MWGSAFMFTKIALAALTPSAIVVGRLAVGALVLLTLAGLGRRRLPGFGRLWLFFIAIAVLGYCLPFLLISWGQQRIDSGLAGILMAVMPLVTVVLAHFFVQGERITTVRAGGFLVGFAGIVLLMGPDAVLGLREGRGDFLPELAVLAGAVCYSVSVIVARLRPESDALVSAAAVLLLASLLSAPLISTPGEGELANLSVGSSLAVAFLGVFSTGVATVVYFRLLTSAGPSFLSLINYLIPLWAVGVGAAFLGERLETNDFYALVLILGGIALTQIGQPPQPGLGPDQDEEAPRAPAAEARGDGGP
jgi:drug/metabolite transporter (DMT)-like permease